MIGEAPPDIVLTDMQMPDIDGLELVTSVRLNYPDLPIILMTAHGSEELATKALEGGASSYVPKEQLAARLSDTVDEIHAINQANRTYDRLLDCSQSVEFAFTLHNDAELIDPLVDLVQQMITGMDVCNPTKRIQVGVAVEQALRNAMMHGNLEINGEAGSQYEQRCTESPYADRRVGVQIHITRSEALFVIRDEGPGFDVGSIGGQIDTGGGRGLVLMHTFMDVVRFNEQGNEVTMIKRRDG